VTDDNQDKQPSLVERWVEEQQQWQRTVLSYLDSVVKNDDFLVHLGNAMRGSLLAGKPYPSAPPPSASTPQTPDDDRLDQVLFALHKLEGQVQDLRMSVEELRAASAAKPARRKAERPKD
jgi:hypothetical protein